jgi:hypothetical protein
MRLPMTELSKKDVMDKVLKEYLWRLKLEVLQSYV